MGFLALAFLNLCVATNALQWRPLPRESYPFHQHRRAGVPRCGPRVQVISVGKTKEKWLESAIEEYTKRLRPTMKLEYNWVRDDAALEDKW
jgi:hypothetical protein